MPVQQHVLNWLYSVLTSEYHDVNRTYNDVATVLARYPTLAPRTDVHTFPNGASALLLHLKGTIPVLFRGATYRFPVSIWVPHAYPREAPLVYVTPTDTMMVRPGQHVDPQGQFYHPYLAGWAAFWDKSTLNDLLSVLSDIFAKEPPVIARQQARTSAQSPPPPQQPPPITPHPPERPLPPTSSPAQPHTQQAEPRPPPPPPKPHQEVPRQDTPRQEARPPPVPPHPHLSSPSPPSAGLPSRYDSAPPLPPQAQTSRPPYQPPPHTQSLPQYANALPPYPPQSPPQTHPHALPQFQPPSGPNFASPGQYTHGQLQPHGQWQPTQQQQAWDRIPFPPHQQQQPPQPLQQKPPPPPNLLDDSLNLEISSQTIEAPPIPPNPEKDALLRQLAQTLASIRQRSRQQNESSMAGLEAQQSAMLSAMSALQAEMGQLTQLSNVISSNTNILHDALRKADAVIEGSRSYVVPDIDELLVAPTVVGNQLYRVVAEERALGDAIFMLGRAVERGRISPAAFAKMTRSLAREWYLKKALARKIAQGMGLLMP
ncbi:UEV-domain-containing protein [Trichoderma citrinoviride]|uniref:UEV-domain-containing protein n=1 Tax=Trichoderma citrinoviride TaxID=58853 RepID=A0A2T4BGC3_9HYPO|nr:UEV-domain-containing protein [Trichoderma citrinoviride]PTB68365.1 UEV-domain-containing protein [Trichoderma citrinoviride]